MRWCAVQMCAILLERDALNSDFEHPSFVSTSRGENLIGSENFESRMVELAARLRRVGEAWEGGMWRVNSRDLRTSRLITHLNYQRTYTEEASLQRY